MKSLQQALIQYDWCPYHKGNLDTDRDRGNTCGDTEGKDGHVPGVMCVQAKDCRKTPEVEEAR